MEIENIITELKFRTSRSGGSGGQHVNKVETKVEALFDVHQSKVLDVAEKEIICAQLSHHISQDGILSVYHQTERSQLGNKEKAIAKITLMIRKALIPPVIRKRKTTPKSVIIKRRADKKLHASKKEHRRFNAFDMLHKED